MIRIITRVTSTANGDVTISCSITDTSKVIVLLDVKGTYTSGNHGNNIDTSGYAAGTASVYLKSVSNSNIVVNGCAFTFDYNKLKSANVTFSYQIIEFM